MGCTPGTHEASPLKFHAFVGQTGKTRKSAYQVKAERIDRYRGGPSPEKFFSLHREGARKPMEHVIGKGEDGRPFFRFSVAGDEEGSGGGGESIEHWLFKEAVASLACTRISIAGRDHRVTITHGETEKLIPGASRPYRADVYLRFQAEEPSELGLKWAGEVYVEIHQSNPVEPGKHDEVRALDLPMIEVDVPPQLAYRHAGPDTTDARERHYVAWLKALLESDRGFLKAVVLSDPSSAPYLAGKLKAAQALLDRQRQQLKATTDALQLSREEGQQLKSAVVTAKQADRELRTELATERRLTADEAAAATAFKRDLDQERAAKAVLARRLRTMTWAVVGLGGLLAALLVAFIRTRAG